ncbi:unnamed protein product [Diamesa tonsa]
MVKNKTAFALGDHVFTKLKGYRAWPSKIIEVVHKNRFNVYFYGTGETAVVKSDDMVVYDAASIQKCAKPETSKTHNKGFKEGLEQIALAVNGNDPAPILDDDDQAEEENNDTMNNTPLEDSAVVDENLDISQDSENQEVINKIATNIKQEKPDNTSVVKSVSVNKKKTKAPPVEVAEKLKEVVASPPKTSRSGRIITKNKKMVDDIEDCKPSAPKQMKADSTIKDEFANTKRRPNDSNRELLQSQYDMIVLIQQIKLALGLEQADPAKCLMILEEIKALCPTLNKFVLLKYPNCVEVIKRLKKYIGNIHIWSMDDVEQKDFEANASRIRERATDIYAVFKSFFEIGEDESFWQKFTTDLKDFETQTANIKFETVNEMCTFEDLQNYVPPQDLDKNYDFH